MSSAFTGRVAPPHLRHRVADDLDSASLSAVSGTPTFFINGRRHYGAYDIESLTEAVKLAKARASIASRAATPA